MNFGSIMNEIENESKIAQPNDNLHDHDDDIYIHDKLLTRYRELHSDIRTDIAKPVK